MRRSIYQQIILLFMGVLAFSGMSAVGALSPALQTTSPVTQGQLRQADGWGDSWAFTVSDGILECIDGAEIVLHHGGVTYAVNGIARMNALEQGWSDLEAIWLDHPDPQYLKVSVMDILQLVSHLCVAPDDMLAPALPLLNTGSSQADLEVYQQALTEHLHRFTAIVDIGTVSLSVVDAGPSVGLSFISLENDPVFFDQLLWHVQQVLPDAVQLRVMIRPESDSTDGIIALWTPQADWAMQHFGQSAVVIATAVPMIAPVLQPSPTPVPVVEVQPTVASAPAAANVYSINAETYTTTGAANIRTCPQTTCAAVVQLTGNSEVVVNGQVNGDVVTDNNGIWYRINYNGQEAYIYSGVVRRGGSTPAQQAPLYSGGQQSAPPPPPVSSGNNWTCYGDLYNCNDFSSWNQMMDYWNACPGDPSQLDRDKNGIPCESMR